MTTPSEAIYNIERRRDISDRDKVAKIHDIKEGMRKGSQVWKEIQQPLDPRTGYSNEHFDRLYGKKNNPHTGTERDNNNRNKKRIFI